SAQSPARFGGGWTNRIHRRSWFCQTLGRACSGQGALARCPVTRPRTFGGKVAISFPATLGENERRGIERRGSISRADGSRKFKAQIVTSHSFSIAPVPLVQAVAFAAASRRIWITNAYCTPTPDQVELLTKAARRGVDVRIMVPGENNDQPLTKSAGRGAYGKLLEGGVRMFEYQPTMIHIKSIVSDSMFTMTGSYNLVP